MIVLDCSAAVEIVRGTEKGKAFSSLMLDGEKVISSDLFYAEVANTFLKYCRAGYCNKTDAQQHIENAIRLVDAFYGLDDFYREAFSESARLEHPAYDMFYFVLARRTGATLFTADRKLAALCSREGVDCVEEAAI